MVQKRRHFKETGFLCVRSPRRILGQHCSLPCLFNHTIQWKANHSQGLIYPYESEASTLALWEPGLSLGPPVTTQCIIYPHLRRHTLCWETELWVFKCYQFQTEELEHPFLQNAVSGMIPPPDSHLFTPNQDGQKFEFVASNRPFFELEWFSPDVGKDIFQLGSKDYTCFQACMYTYIHTKT